MINLDKEILEYLSDYYSYNSYYDVRGFQYIIHESGIKDLLVLIDTPTSNSLKIRIHTDFTTMPIILLNCLHKYENYHLYLNFEPINKGIIILEKKYTMIRETENMILITDNRGKVFGYDNKGYTIDYTNDNLDLIDKL